MQQNNTLPLFHNLFVVCNSKNQVNSSDKPGNAALPNDSKTKFLSHFAEWFESYSECQYFTQTSDALITTLRGN